MVNHRGQAAVESLLVLLIIITAVIFILGLYSQTHDNTIGISIVRTEVTSLANSMDELVLIKQVYLMRGNNGENIFVIITDPANLTENEFGSTNLNAISEKIVASTRLKNITFQIN